MSATCWGVVLPVVAIVSDPLREPVVTGVNVTPTRQLAPAISGPLHVFVCAKSPAAVTPEIATALAVVLLTVTVCGALVESTVSEGNCRADGETVSGEPAPGGGEEPPQASVSAAAPTASATA